MEFNSFINRVNEVNINQGFSEERLEETFSVIYNASPSDERSEMLLRVANGKKIAGQILELRNEYPESNLQNALDFTWFCIACACQESQEPFTRGVTRLYPLSKEISNKISDFFCKCKEAHSRPSSHFKDMTIGKQLGLDFGKKTLPLDKELGTMLCGQLNDYSFFIKLEREPISLTSPVKSIKHLKNWGKHIISGGGEQVVGGHETRRETDGQKDVRDAFADLLVRWKELKPQVNPIKEIKTHDRIFKMYHRVESLKNEIFSLKGAKGLGSTKYTNLMKSIEKFDEAISRIDHPDVISGREVLVDLKKYL